MLQKMFCVKDVKVGFGVPFVADNDAVAMRNFTVSVRQSDSLMHWCKPDYALYCVGMLDTESGVVTGLETPVHLMDATDVVDDIDK